jgi:hypothetical protein
MPIQVYKSNIEILIFFPKKLKQLFFHIFKNKTILKNFLCFLSLNHKLLV